MKDISIKINEKEIPLTKFPKEFIISTILGMLKALHGVDDIESVEIKINN